jgi:hypothetical protein
MAHDRLVMTAWGAAPNSSVSRQTSSRQSATNRMSNSTLNWDRFLVRDNEQASSSRQAPTRSDKGGAGVPGRAKFWLGLTDGH